MKVRYFNMPAIGIVAQAVEENKPSTNLAVVTRKQLKANEALTISKKFCEYISSLLPQPENPLLESGSFVALQKYRLTYYLCQEVYIYVVAMEMDNPFVGADILHNAKEVLYSLCRGGDVTAIKLARSVMELNFALRRALHGQVGTDILTQKTMEMSPHSSLRDTLKDSHSSSSLSGVASEAVLAPGDIFYNRVAEISKISCVFPQSLFSDSKVAPPVAPPRRK